MRRGRLFQALTVVLLLACVWMIYANVLSDDTELRARAGDLARKEAGCGDACKMTGMRGERGMLSTEITYDFDGKGSYVVTCRRAYVLVGEHACTVSRP